MARSLIIVSLVLLLGGCQTVGSRCWGAPILPSPGFEERLTRSEKEQIIAHNEAGEQICGWR